MEKSVGMKLNKDQREAAEQLLSFLLSDDRMYHLSGAAGTGKTYMMKYIIKELLRDYAIMCKVMGFGKPKTWDIAFTATTNKAAEALADSIGEPATTIHKYLGLRVYNDYKTGEVKLSRNPKYGIVENTLIFIDEASMIDKALFEYIKTTISKTCKIIFVGDRFQLAPVGEDLSSIYSEQANMSELFEPMRNNSQPALMNLCQQFRDTVNTGKFAPIKLVKGVIEHLDGPETQALMDKIFIDNNCPTKVLCYTNQRVVSYANYVRKLRGLGKYYTVGERLIVSSPYKYSQDKLIPAETEVLVEDTDYTEQTIVIGGELVNYHRILVKAGLSASIWVRWATEPNKMALLLGKFKKAKDWSSYYSIQETFIDMRPRESSTVHKSQGSTYESVIIDLDDIGKHFDRNDVARMLYVAVSRAKTKIYLRGSLPIYYGGSPYHGKDS